MRSYIFFVPLLTLDMSSGMFVIYRGDSLMIQQLLGRMIDAAMWIKGVAWATFLLLLQAGETVLGWIWKFLGPKVATLLTYIMISYCVVSTYIAINYVGKFDNVFTATVSYTVGKLDLEKEALEVAKALK